MTRPIVMKFGGELLEERAALATVVASVDAVALSLMPPRADGLVIVHGGGKEIDAALKVAGIEKRQVDGLRITDEATLEIVVSVVAGIVNTRFVAALNAVGVAAVGLTGADGKCGLSALAPPHRAVDGRLVELGRVGVPDADSDTHLLQTLLGDGFLPVIACVGAGRAGELFNVNADTLAGHIATKLGARRLVIAGTTAGVLNTGGETMPILDTTAMAALVTQRTATAGMIAKLRAAEQALNGGVDDVVIVDGRDRRALVDAARSVVPLGATRLIRMVPA